MVRETAKRTGRKAVGGAAKAPAKEQEKDEEDEGGKVEEFRYKHLLEPIRDLTVNWNVDIARDLEGYLGELELLEISLDGGNLLNFAEAALLIQVCHNLVTWATDGSCGALRARVKCQAQGLSAS
jgi:hypothetical protein